jgi:hypothetical protein
MLQARLKKGLTTNWHFIGVILFFIIHGYSEHQGLIPLRELLLLLAVLLAAGLILFGVSRKLFKMQAEKAGLFTSFVLALVLFFSVFQDFFTSIRFLSFIGRLVIFFPLCIAAMIAALVWLKKTGRPFKKGVFFINTVLAVYIIVDLCIIATHFLFPVVQQKDKSLEKLGLRVCDTCARPPVYFVLLDSYFGSAGLREFYQYDNSRVDNFLRQQGFHVTDSAHSNYLHTLFSMASLLNMNYLEGKGSITIENHYAYKAGVAAVRNNTVCHFFKEQGYQIRNYSIFDIDNIPAGHQSGLMPDKIQLITQQTMYYRVKKYGPPFLARMKWVPGLEKSIENDFVGNNERMLNLTLSASREKQEQPVFTYLHLMMPHMPFSYDSVGNRTVPAAAGSVSIEKMDDQFLQYEVYANKRMITFIEQLKAATRGEAVIVLMSDHGYRPAGRKKRSLACQTLNAVYLPSQNYAGWYNGMTNVNQFRVLFNTLFDQRLPMLKDSIVYY